MKNDGRKVKRKVKMRFVVWMTFPLSADLVLPKEEEKKEEREIAARKSLTP